MSLSRWKMMAGVLGVSIGGLAAAASQCPKWDKSKGRQQESPVALADKAEVKLPPAGPPSMPPTAPTTGAAVPPPAPELPAIPPPAATGPAIPAAPQLTPAGSTPPPAIEVPKPSTPMADAPKMPALPPVPDITPVKAEGPAVPPIPPKPSEPGKPEAGPPTKPTTTLPAPSGDILPPAPGKPTTPPPSAPPSPEPVTLPPAKPPATAPDGRDLVGKPIIPPAGVVPSVPPTGAPTAPVAAPPADPLVVPDAPPARPPVPPTPPVAAAQSKFRILLHVGEGEPTFEVKNGENLMLKVACEKVDIKSPEKGAGLSEVTARGKVRFAGFGAEGTCDELKFLAGTGEVQMTGEVKVQVKDKLGRVESELTSGTLRYKIDASAVGGQIKP